MEKPVERTTRPDRIACGYFARKIPYSLGGDPARDASLVSKAKIIMPNWWPIQYEEWDLDYWTTRGYTIFVLMEGAGFSGSGIPMYDEPLYRSFHDQIRGRCELVATLPTTRPLFYEQKVWVYRLRDPNSPGAAGLIRSATGD